MTVEPASPGPDSDTTMDTMEVDSSDMDCGRGIDDPDEPSTPDERMFEMDSPLLDREKDEEPIKTIRYDHLVRTAGVMASCPPHSSDTPIQSRAGVHDNMTVEARHRVKRGGGGGGLQTGLHMLTAAGRLKYSTGTI